MSEAERVRLREVAEAATPGPWEVYQTTHAEAWVCEVGRGGFGAVSLPATGRPDYGLANAEHVATFDPPTVLAFLDDLASRDARLAAVEALHPKVEHPTHGCCAPPKLCRGHAPECGGREHGLNRPAWPCPTLRALHSDPSEATP